MKYRHRGMASYSSEKRRQQKRREKNRHQQANRENIEEAWRNGVNGGGQRRIHQWHQWRRIENMAWRAWRAAIAISESHRKS